MGHETVEIAFILSDAEAAALAAFVRRAGFCDFRNCADSRDEAYDMVHAAAHLRTALRLAGYDE